MSQDPRAKEIYEACPFCGSNDYSVPEIADSEGDGGKILIEYRCYDCNESWNYWYKHHSTCWEDTNEKVVELLRKQGKVVVESSDIQ